MSEHKSLSELTPAALLRKAKQQGLIRPHRFVSLLLSQKRKQNETVGAH